MKREGTSFRIFFPILLFCMVLFLSACARNSSDPSSEQSTQSNAKGKSDEIKTESTTQGTAFKEIIAKASGQFNGTNLYTGENSLVISADGDRYRIDVDIGNNEDGKKLDFSFYEGDQAYACVSFDGIIPPNILEDRHKYQPIPLEDGKLPERVRFSITSEMDPFDEANEKILQDFLQGNVDEINPAFYLFDPDGYVISTVVSFAKPEQIRWGAEYLEEPFEYTPSSEPKYILHADLTSRKAEVALVKEEKSDSFEVQLVRNEEFIGESAYLYVSTNPSFPFSIHSSENATVEIPLVDKKIDSDQVITVPVESVLRTEEERESFQAFLKGEEEIFPLSLSIHGEDFRIVEAIEVKLERVAENP